MLSVKSASSTIFWVFGMTQPRLERRSPGQLANILLIMLMARSKELTNIKQTLVNNNFPNKLIDQQIKLYFHKINKNKNNTNTKIINLYYKNQMHKNCKLDEQVITNIINKPIKPIEHQKQNSLPYTLNLNVKLYC